MTSRTVTSSKGDPVFCVDTGADGVWYMAKYGQMANLTIDQVQDGVDLEQLHDIDCFSWPDGIETEQEFLQAVMS